MFDQEIIDRAHRVQEQFKRHFNPLKERAVPDPDTALVHIPLDAEDEFIERLTINYGNLTVPAIN